MSGIRSLVLGCVSEQSRIAAEITPTTTAMPTKRLEKVKFGVPLAEALKDDNIPMPLVEILVHIAQEGVTSLGLFRRSGNILDQKMIVKRLIEGKPVLYSHYNHYTLTGVIKKFLLKIPGGIFGAEVEASLLEVLDMPNKQDQYDRIQSVMSSLPLPTQHLLVLLFGTWFRTVNHVQYSSMSSEAIGKSVAGSVFHTCASDQHRAERAAKVLKLMIDDFGVACLFGRNNLDYFADVTGTCLKVNEHFQYEYRYPVDDCLEASVTSDDALRTPLARGSRERSSELIVSSVSASPQSLPQQQHQSQCLSRPQQRDPGFNPHRTLKQMSSVSAPDVNKLQSIPTPQLAASKVTQLSTSVTSFDQVKRRQFVHLKMRANWFLAADEGNATAADQVPSLSGHIAAVLMGDHAAQYCSATGDEGFHDDERLSTSRYHAPLSRLAYGGRQARGVPSTTNSSNENLLLSSDGVAYQHCRFLVQRTYGLPEGGQSASCS